jgi:hypothetical protein
MLQASLEDTAAAVRQRNYLLQSSTLNMLKDQERLLPSDGSDRSQARVATVDVPDPVDAVKLVSGVRFGVGFRLEGVEFNDLRTSCDLVAVKEDGPC